MEFFIYIRYILILLGDLINCLNGFVVNEFKNEKFFWIHPMIWFVTYDECKKYVLVNLWVATNDELTKEKVECSTFLQLMNLEKKSL